MRSKIFLLVLVTGYSLLVTNVAWADPPAVGTVTLATSSSTPAAQVVQAGTSNVTLLEFSLEPTAAEDVLVDSVSVQVKRKTDAGEMSAETTDVTNLALFDGNKFWNSSLANDGSVMFALPNVRLIAGSHVTMRLVGTVTAGANVMLAAVVPNGQSVVAHGVQSGQQLIVSGSAAGNTTQVRAAPAARPDLVVADFSWAPGSVAISPVTSRIRLAVTIRNDGTGSTILPAGLTINFYWKNVGTPLSAWRSTEQRMLAPGQVWRLENIDSFADSNLGTIAGAFPIFAEVDASNVVDEQGEGNNLLQKTISVIGVLPQDITPPGISALQVSRVTSIDAVASWTTSEVATGMVEFGTSTNFGYARSDFTYLPTHYFALTQLTPGTKYFYRVRSRDAAGNETISETRDFITAAIREAESIPRLTFSLSTVTPPPTTVQPGLANVSFLKFMVAATGTDSIEVRSLRLRLYRDDPTPFLPVESGDITAVRLFDDDKQIGVVTQFEQSMATFQFNNKEMVIPAGINRTYTVVADLGVRPKARLLHIDLAHASIREDIVARGVKTGAGAQIEGGANGQFMALGVNNVPAVAPDGRSAAPTADVDGDGLTEEQEILYHTDPRNADTDGDSFPDGIEVKHGHDPRSTCRLETGILKPAALACRSKYLRSALTNLGIKKLPTERNKAWQDLLKKFVYDFASPARLAEGLRKK